MPEFKKEDEICENCAYFCFIIGNVGKNKKRDMIPTCMIPYYESIKDGFLPEMLAIHLMHPKKRPNPISAKFCKPLWVHFSGDDKKEPPNKIIETGLN